MLKAGIFLDVENLKRCGGWGMRFDVIRRLVEAQGTTVIRANAYMVIDTEKEANDFEYRMRQERIRDAFRGCGFKIILKPITRFESDDGASHTKGNTDMDLAVDALTQTDDLDYVLIGSGDGDFVPLVRALQARCKRVDILSFSLMHTSNELRCEADWYFNGCLVPGMIAMNAEVNNRRRGVIYNVTRDGYGFIKFWEGLANTEVVDSVFFHFSDFKLPEGVAPTPELFTNMQRNQVVLDFELYRKRDGNLVAKDIYEFRPNFWNEFRQQLADSPTQENGENIEADILSAPAPKEEEPAQE